MNGQWLGRYSGTDLDVSTDHIEGVIMIDIDDRRTHYEGRAYIYEERPNYPSTFAHFKTDNRANKFELYHLPVSPIDSEGEPTSWEAVKALYPNVVFPTTANVQIAFDHETLRVAWQTTIGTTGRADIVRSRADKPSDYKPLEHVKNWEQFKTFVGKLEPRHHIFRGQGKPHRLRTGFHRTGRADLMRFQNEDVWALYRNLSLRTRHLFDLKVADQYGAFLNLAQHHGFPTPLLDWTYSPYVGAFFAYRSGNNDVADAAKDKNVRIFAFDQRSWIDINNIQSYKLSPFQPHISIKDFIAIENPRTIPQQSVSSVTNVDDIEGYIQQKQTFEDEYLRVIDLPLNERRLVMRELSSMGVTAGSLFPGLDGACEELRERFFYP